MVLADHVHNLLIYIHMQLSIKFSILSSIKMSRLAAARINLYQEQLEVNSRFAYYGVMFKLLIPVEINKTIWTKKCLFYKL